LNYVVSVNWTNVVGLVYNINLVTNPPAGGSVTGAGKYACTYPAGLVATTNSGYGFSGWSGYTNASNSSITVQSFSNITLTANFTNVPTGLKTSLLAYWKMDESSGSRLDSISNFNLTVAGSVPATNGIINNAAWLAVDSAANYLNLTNNTLLNFGTGDFSFQFWFQLHGIPTTGSQSPTLLESPAYTSGILIRFSGATLASVSLQCFLNGNDHQILTVPITADKTYHLTVVRTSGSLQFYTNGVACGSAITATENLSITTGAGTIGNDNRLHVDPWWGWIDEVGIWNRALTSGEVSTLYNSGAGKAFSTF
jgi:hypothetical protein